MMGLDFELLDREIKTKRLLLMFYVIFCGIILGIAETKAAEVYCSLNDGIKADGKTVLEHQGSRYQFCCSGCLDKFKADPENFTQQIDELGLTNTMEA